jgi:type IV secretion system protein VirD4
VIGANFGQAFEPALGAAWLDVFGVKVYAPWKLFGWWLAFDAQAPRRVRAGD